MGLSIQGQGNVGDEVTHKTITKDGRELKIAEFSVCFDEVSKNAAGEYEQTSETWVKVTAWSHLADECSRILKKGMRVYVSGDLRTDTWTDKESGAVKSRLICDARDVTLVTYRLESVQLRQKKVAEAA